MFADHLPELWSEALVDHLQQDDLVEVLHLLITEQSRLSSLLSQDAWRQIQIDLVYNIVVNDDILYRVIFLIILHFFSCFSICLNDHSGQLFPIGFSASVVLDLDV